ncbi:MAG: hypothetical protein RIT45_2297 [Pseudomonadota bacterium]|jgi:hypothetical protein
MIVQPVTPELLRRPAEGWRTAATVVALTAVVVVGGCARKGEVPAAAPAPTASAPTAAAPTAAAATAPQAAAPAEAKAEVGAAASGQSSEETMRRIIAERAAAAGVPEVGDQVPGLAPERMAVEMARAGGSPGERRFEGPADLVRRIRNVAANHNLPGLERYMTPKLVASTREMMPQHAERFWRHLDRYAQAGAHGFELEQKAGAEEGTLELVVKAAPDIVLRPVLRRTDAGWRFERF